MIFISLILSVTGLLTAIASMLDKFYNDNGKNDLIRIRLIKIFAFIDDKTPDISGRELITFIKITPIFILTFLLIAFFIYVQFFLYKLTAGYLPGFLATINRWAFYFTMPKIFIFSLLAIICVAASVFMLLASAYGLARILALGFLGQVTHPTRSPLAYTIAILGIASALGKLFLDLAKALLGA